MQLFAIRGVHTVLGHRILTTEGGRSLAVMVAPSIPEEMFDGLEADRLYSLHRDALKAGSARIYCETKRRAWAAGQNLPEG